MFKECLKNNIVPFIIDEDLKMFYCDSNKVSGHPLAISDCDSGSSSYYRGLSEWNNEKGYLTDTCLAAQDKFKTYLEYFKVPYKK